jgi:anaerobic magnesium-protoporphyrin IX monomethyl ester cyclase
MKIAIGYPPLNSKKGSPLLSQNRQFQWFSSPTYIYPMVPASAATLLKKNHYSVCWLDGIAENWTYSHWLKQLKSEKPDLLLLETKTPVIKQHWKIVKQLKKQLPQLKIAFCGDHVTALPKESFKHSPIDYVLAGGNYDFVLLSLSNHLKNQGPLSPGIYYRTKQGVVSTGPFQLNQALKSLPFIDRHLTRWQLYAYKNGNFKYTPGTYIMAGRDCWWRKKGGCFFCAWTSLYPHYSVRSVNNVLDEIDQLIQLGIKEIFDDTGTFPSGQWLRDFCTGLIERGYHKKVTLGCNLRFNCLTKEDYLLLAQANFRLLLYGLESANQITLNRINKGIKIEQIEPELKILKAANRTAQGQLEPHVTCMIGYPWETYQQAQNTVKFCRRLFQKGLIDSLQATIIIPYPGTRLFKQAQQRHWLKTKNWDKYDMSQPILKSPLTSRQTKQLTRSIYTAALSPQFLLKKLLSIRSAKDLKYLFHAGSKIFSHWLDFS